MREVYSSAVLTVVATNSPSTHSDIFAKRETGERAPLEWGESTKSSKEGLLAPRTLSYGAQQMIWECPCYQADEGGRITLATEDYRSKGFIQNLIRIQNTRVVKPQHPLLRKFEKFNLRASKPEKWWKSYAIADPHDKWNDIAGQFMRRSLTKDSDALRA
ncbi:uncharacterized protein PAC_12967 [Phialocephala subalpina]|uniref:Uncharacterized protein n=1 Tax=Phialocephala subalpina TaxID=576137 RepID=A0A1L7XDE7_9HELO|nr:uncharacterized protein PAC_12967 [Phialocephala subalpina]